MTLKASAALRAAQIRRIAHRVQSSGDRELTNQSILVQPDSARCVRPLRPPECQHRQARPNEHHRRRRFSALRRRPSVRCRYSRAPRFELLWKPPPLLRMPFRASHITRHTRRRNLQSGSMRLSYFPRNCGRRLRKTLPDLRRGRSDLKAYRPGAGSPHRAHSSAADQIRSASSRAARRSAAPLRDALQPRLPRPATSRGYDAIMISNRSASSAGIISPLSKSTAARAGPTSRGRKYVPPKSG